MTNSDQISKDDYPRSMREADVRQRRRKMLYEDHIEPLTAYAAQLRNRPLVEVPDFDPLDGGVDARVLFLFEKPGPMTASGPGQKQGSGFISRNNDDPTAEATFKFMEQAGIPRKLTITWNLIPWWNRTRKVTGQELREGLESLAALISILRSLRAVVLVGRHAARAEASIRENHPRLRVFTFDHPSPLVRAKYPQRWNAIPSKWSGVVEAISD